MGKHKYRRILSLIIASALMLPLVACGADGDDEGLSVSERGTRASTGFDGLENFKIPDNLPGIKIGAVGLFSDNELYIQWRRNLESLSEPFNVEFIFVERTLTDEPIEIFKNLVADGVDGIIAQAASEELARICYDAGVPFVTYCMFPDDDTLQAMARYDTFLGVLAEDDIEAAMTAATTMYEAGVRDVGVITLERGIAVMIDDRVDYFVETFKSLGGNIIAEDYSARTMLELSYAVSGFAANYPEMDGLFSAILNEELFKAISDEGLAGKIKIAGFDMTDSCRDFFRSGDLVYANTGQQATIVAAFAPLYNYIHDGSYLIENRARVLFRPFAEAFNYEDYVQYDQYVRFSTCYSPEEVAFMIMGFNPAFTPADFITINREFSIQEVRSRTIE